MGRCLILCQNKPLAGSLRQWLQSALNVSETTISTKIVETLPQPTSVSYEFRNLSEWIETELSNLVNAGSKTELVILTDLCGYGRVDLNDLHPVIANGWKTVLSMLILAFPEVYWLFPTGILSKTSNQISSEDVDVLREFHFINCQEKLSQKIRLIFQNGLSPVFDGTRLRDSIRCILNSDKKNQRIIRRDGFAVAVDEEQSYAWFHAFTAYRFRFRSLPITTFAAMNYILKESNLPVPDVVLEDYFLQFGDEKPAEFSSLQKRDKRLVREDGRSYLAEASNRILITSGHHRGQNWEAKLNNPIYLKELRINGQWNRELYKPLAGVFNLWRDSGLLRKLPSKERTGWLQVDKLLDESEYVDGHGAPGRILVIAECLLNRGERSLKDVHTVAQAVTGALLATDALELICNKTPTIALEALSLKHQFEVLAECQFVGMQHHIEIVARMREIRKEIQVLSKWFGAKNRHRLVAMWNAELSIINKMIDVFRSYNQFDEEQILQVRVRELNRKLRFTNYPTLIKPVEILPWYVEKLVASFPLFLIAIFFWIIILGQLFTLVTGVSWGQGFTDAYTTFLGLGPPDDPIVWKPEQGLNLAFCLLALTIALGFIHLGIFISHLYSLISRK